MSYLFLIGAVCASAQLSIMAAVYNKRNTAPETKNVYNLLYMIASFLSWAILYIFDFSFEPTVLIYSVGYAVLYNLAVNGLVKALSCGSVSLTSFLKQLSIAAVSIWGFIFWGSKFTTFILIAFALIILSLFLCLGGKNGEKGEKISLKWFFYVSLLFLSNAGCSIVQKQEQIDFLGEHGTQLMCFGTFFSMIISLAVIFKNGTPNFNVCKKGSFKFPLFAGMSSALLNLFIILMAQTTLSPSLIYPSIAVGGMLLSIVFSVLVYKERLSFRQILGLLLGIVALIFLNLK